MTKIDASLTQQSLRPFHWPPDAQRNAASLPLSLTHTHQHAYTCTLMTDVP